MSWQKCPGTGCGTRKRPSLATCICPKMAVSSSEKKAGGQRGPYRHSQELEGMAGTHGQQVTRGQCLFSRRSFSPFSVPESGAAALFQAVGVNAVTTSSFRCFSKMALSKSVFCQRLLGVRRPLRFPESKRCQVPFPVDCSKVRTAVVWLLFLRNGFLESTYTAWAAGTWSSLG